MATTRWLTLFCLGFMSASAWAQSSDASLVSETSRASFRPTPIRGSSLLEGRSLDLRPTNATPKIFGSGSIVVPVPTAQTRQAAAAASRSRLRAAQQARSQRAALSSQQSLASARRRSPASHVLTVGFEPPTPSERFAVDRAQLQERWINAAGARLGVEGLSLDQVDGETILRGRAETPEQARRAEQLLRLEPGVYDVVNQIEVTGPSTMINVPTDR